jgi:translation elongation factor EF-4
MVAPAGAAIVPGMLGRGISRGKRLLEKQQEGEKRMPEFGSASILLEAFIAHCVW